MGSRGGGVAVFVGFSGIIMNFSFEFGKGGGVFSYQIFVQLCESRGVLNF